jgi:hypothetical protein
MIGRLPKTLEIDGTEYPIRTDYRTVLLIIKAFNDVNLNDIEKTEIMLECLFINWFEICRNVDIRIACEKARWFIECGEKWDKSPNNAKLMDWEQDEQLIFSAINVVANKEVREVEYMHWWTFMGYFKSIGESVFSTYVNIRKKISKGKKLEKWEKEIYEQNIDAIKIKTKLSDQEKEYLKKVGLEVE